jgi:spore maturation protein CgeB
MSQVLAPHTTIEFTRNMEALHRVDPEMMERIHLPVDGSHVKIEPNKPPKYKIHRYFYPFVTDKDHLPNSLSTVDGKRDVFLFGIGLGEQLGYLLDHYSGIKVAVWDRDPWLVRLALSRRDYSAEILSGRMRLFMCADLLEAIRLVKGRCLVCHPFLGAVYRFERRLLDQGIGKNRILLQTGTLFVDDVAQALNSLGYSVYTLDTRLLSREEQSRTVRLLCPSFIFAVNYTEGLAEFCQQEGCRLVCWEIDPSLSWLRRVRAPTEKTYVFTYRKANVAHYHEAGFKNVSYMPLAADPKKRAPLDLDEADRNRYAAPLSFVGASMVSEALTFRKRFINLYAAWCGKGVEGKKEGGRLLDEVLALQRRDFSRFVLDQLLDQRLSRFISDSKQFSPTYNPLMLAAEISASEKRLTYVANLAKLGVVVWGDRGWATVQEYGVRYMGRHAHHTKELTKVYSATRINIDIGRLYQSDIVTMRVFDVMACGGFLLTERSDALLDLFKAGVEVETYVTLGELREKATFYLSNPQAARRIAARGMEAVRRLHDIRSRVKQMIGSI